MGDCGTPTARHLRDLARRLRGRPAPRLPDPSRPHHQPPVGIAGIAEPFAISAFERRFGLSLAAPEHKPIPARFTIAWRSLRTSERSLSAHLSHCGTFRRRSPHERRTAARPWRQELALLPPEAAIL